VALFNVPAAFVTSSTVPIDAVVYGPNNNSSLIDETGSANAPEVGDASSGSSIERTDLGGSWQIQSSPTPGTTPISGEGDPPEATTMHVVSIVPDVVGNNKKQGTVVVAFEDDLGEVVDGVQVTGTFTGDFDETRTATSNASGEATLTTQASIKVPIAYTVCVDSATHQTLSYAPGDNVETCDSY
jgi:hypothetical protein